MAAAAQEKENISVSLVKIEANVYVCLLASIRYNNKVRVKANALLRSRGHALIISCKFSLISYGNICSSSSIDRH